MFKFRRNAWWKPQITSLFNTSSKVKAENIYQQKLKLMQKGDRQNVNKASEKGEREFVVLFCWRRPYVSISEVKCKKSSCSLKHFFEARSSGRLNDSKYMLSCTSVFGVRFYHCYHHKICVLYLWYVYYADFFGMVYVYNSYFTSCKKMYKFLKNCGPKN